LRALLFLNKVFDSKSFIRSIRCKIFLLHNKSIIEKRSKDSSRSRVTTIFRIDIFSDVRKRLTVRTVRVEFYFSEKIKIRNMVVTLRNVASSNSLNWKMKHFYESCMNLDNIETDEGKPLKKIISTILGTFFVVVPLYATVDINESKNRVNFNGIA